ncbi:MAG: hypothetical protein AAFU67_13000, partial [Bacteroidota bacterium]
MVQHTLRIILVMIWTCTGAGLVSAQQSNQPSLDAYSMEGLTPIQQEQLVEFINSQPTSSEDFSALMMPLEIDETDVYVCDGEATLDLTIINIPAHPTAYTFTVLVGLSTVCNTGGNTFFVPVIVPANSTDPISVSIANTAAGSWTNAANDGDEINLFGALNSTGPTISTNASDCATVNVPNNPTGTIVLNATQGDPICTGASVTVDFTPTHIGAAGPYNLTFTVNGAPGISRTAPATIAGSAAEIVFTEGVDFNGNLNSVTLTAIEDTNGGDITCSSTVIEAIFGSPLVEVILPPTLSSVPSDETGISSEGVNQASCVGTIDFDAPVINDGCPTLTTSITYSNTMPVGAPTTFTSGQEFEEVAFPIGTTTVTFTVTDGGGNVATDNTFDVTVEDAPPSASCVSAFTVQLDASGNGSIDEEDIDNGSSDNCMELTYSFSQSAFACSDVSSTPIIVTMTVTDGGGQTDDCTTSITVEDNVAPTAVCVTGLTISLDGDGVGELVAA